RGASRADSGRQDRLSVPSRRHRRPRREARGGPDAAGIAESRRRSRAAHRRDGAPVVDRRGAVSAGLRPVAAQGGRRRGRAGKGLVSADRDGAAARRDGAMTRPLRIASVCRLLPTPTDSGAGVFVLRRLGATNGGANGDVVQLVPFFPFIKPLPAWARPPSRTLDAVAVRHAPMFYIPKFFKTADAFWLARAIEREIERLHRQEPLDAIDAHFGYPDGAGCVRLGRRLGIPVFVTLRGVEQEYLEVPGIGSQLLWAVRNAAGCVA